MHVTAQAQADSRAGGTGGQAAPDLGAMPWRTLSDSQLADLELLLSGAFWPLAGFMTMADVAAVADSWQLADGTPFPVPVTLDVPADAVPADAGYLALADPEGTPLAVLRITERTPLPGDQDLVRLAGPVTARRVPEHGPFRRLMLTPAAARQAAPDGPVLAWSGRGPLHGRQIGQLRHLAGQLRARLLILPLTGGQAEVVTRPEALVRTALAAAGSLPSDSRVIPVPLAPRPRQGAPADARAREVAIQARTAAAYGATHLMADGDALAALGQAPGAAPTTAGPAGSGQIAGGVELPAALIPVLPSGDWAYDPRAEVWRPLALIEAGTEQADLSADQLGDLLDAGAPVPEWFTPPGVTRELRRARPPRSARGFVLFLTGLSGSGKSTIARDLRDVLAERGDRRVTLLDGDLVRSLLSAGAGFSRADRDQNIARIGFVAAEVARHGGIAICAPIAPFAEPRARVREMVSEVGDFLLIHVATPVEVCEARDRKGLYARARAGLITQFTGISDPYEEPVDADLVVDTSLLTEQEAVAAVLRLLTSGGWLGPDQA
jgi:sulfate adenylyltransferase